MLEPLPCRDGSIWRPDWRFESFLNERFQNLGTEWQKMLVWLTSHEANRKTPRGMKAFVGNWMNRTGVLRHRNNVPARYEPVDKSVGRQKIEQIKAVLRGREPGADEGV